MFRLPALVVSCLLINEVPGPVVAADEWQQLLPSLELVGNKQYREAIARYEKYLQQALKALRGPVEFEIATMHSALGNTERALVMLEQAIQSGFDDCIAIQQDADLKPIRNDPRFQDLYSRVRISEADLKELYWLKSEMQNISHDTNMMITESMARLDGGSTVFSRSMIPVRETASPGVLFKRELFIAGVICTFDGLTDRDGNLVFYTSHQYSLGVMETVNQDANIYYYSLRDIPQDLEDAGRRVLKAFNVRERFFHFEFFRDQDNRIVALEVNMRPPGGLTTDMFNYANDIDIYGEWAYMVVYNSFNADYQRKYHCAYISRKSNRNYVYSHEQILSHCHEYLVHHQTISGVFSAALGDYGYLVRSPELSDIYSLAEYIQKTT